MIARQLLAGALAIGLAQTAPPPSAVNDADVLRVVAEQAYPPLNLIVRNVVLCNSARPEVKLCVTTPSVGWSEQDGWKPRIAGLSQAARSELLSSFIDRNKSSQPLPPFARAAAPPTPPASQQADAPLRARVGIGDSLALSLPGYSRDGHALVYAVCTCRGLPCDSALWFLLERVGSAWKLQSKKEVLPDGRTTSSFPGSL